MSIDPSKHANSHGGRLLQPSQAGGAESLPRKDAPTNRPFLLVHMPGDWQFYDDIGEWLPTWRNMHLEPGVQGIKSRGKRRDGSEQIDDSALRGVMRKRKAVVLDIGDIRLERFANFISVHDNDAGGAHHRTIFSAPDVFGQKCYWTHNPEYYREFQRFCVSHGIVEPMHPRAKAKQIDLQIFDLKVTRSRLGKNPSHTGLSSALSYVEARLQAMEHSRPVSDFLGKIEPVRGTTPIDIDAAPALAPSEAKASDDDDEPRKDARKRLNEELKKLVGDNPGLGVKVLAGRKVGILGHDVALGLVDQLRREIEASQA